MATCSVPPYCGRVSARAASASIKRLLTASHRQTIRFITPGLSISGDGNCRVAFRFCPQSGDGPGEIDGGADCHRVAIGELIGAHRVLGLIVLWPNRGTGQNLPARATGGPYAGQIAAPSEFGCLVAHAVNQVRLSID